MLKRTFKALAGVEFPVIAGYDNDSGVPREVVLAMHECGECHTTVIANKLTSPTCPACASSISATTHKDLTLSRANIKELSPIGVCAGCDTKWVGDENVVAALSDGTFHCIVCSGIVEAGSDDMEDEVDADEDVGDDEMPMDDVSSEEEMEDMGDEEDMGDSDEVSDESDMSDEEPSDEDAEEIDEEMSIDDEDGVDVGDDEMPMDDDGGMPLEDSGDMDDGGVLDDEEVGEEMTDAESMEDDEDVDSSPVPGDDEELDSIEARVLDFVNDQADFELVMAGAENPQWYLFADDIPVAIASRSRAKEVIQSCFATDKFKQLFFAAASDNGLTSETFNDFGFDAVKVDIPVTDAVKKQTEDAITEATAAYALRTKTVAADMEQSLGIAAVGMNKGLLNISNPLIAALTQKLEKYRVRNAEAVVTAAFREHGEAFLKSLVAKAIEIAGKSPEAREEIAKMVSEAEYRTPVVASVSDDEPSAPHKVLSFMANGETTVSREPSKESGSMADIDRLVGSIGRRII